MFVLYTAIGAPLFQIPLAAMDMYCMYHDQSAVDKKFKKKKLQHVHAASSLVGATPNQDYTASAAITSPSDYLSLG